MTAGSCWQWAALSVLCCGQHLLLLQLTAMQTRIHAARWPGLLRWAGLTAAVGLVLAACTPPAPSASPPPPSTTSTIVPTPRSPVGLTLNGDPTIGPGHATLSGTVEGPSGPVEGATVEVERLLGASAATTMVTSGAGGAWQLPGVLGGRYAIRAWMAPNLAQATPTTFFITDGTDRFTSLQLASPAPSIQSAIAPDPPLAGEPAQVVVQIDSPQVQVDGSLTSQPDGGLSVQLISSGGWVIAPPNPAVTSADGQAVWTATCGAGGGQSLQAEVLGLPSPASPSAPSPQTVTLDVPACTPLPPVTAPPTIPSTTNPTPPSTTNPTSTLPGGATTLPGGATTLPSTPAGG